MEILQPLWRGTMIQSRKDVGGKYVAMRGAKSLLYIPVDVSPNSTYRVTLELKRSGGNGLAFCNIYGNRKFDFCQSKISCSGSSWNTYDIDITTKEFPKTLPLVFRIWRSPAGTGELFVRKIVISLLSEECETQNQTLISSDPSTPAKKTRDPNDDLDISSLNVEEPKKPQSVTSKRQKRQLRRENTRERARLNKLREIKESSIVEEIIGLCVTQKKYKLCKRF